MQGLQWQKLYQCNEKPFTAVQRAEAGAKPSSCKPLLRKVLDVQNADKLSELVTTGIHIGSKVGTNSCKILSSKATQVYPENTKSGLGVKL